MRLQRRRRHRVEQDRGRIVLVPAHFADDGTLLRRNARRFDSDPGHTVCFDGQQQVELASGDGGEIGGLVDPGVAVPLAACIIDRIRRRAVRKILAGTEGQVFEVIDEKVRGNTTEVLERTRRDKVLPREAAVQIARERVAKAMQYQRFTLRRRLQESGVKPVFRAVS